MKTAKTFLLLVSMALGVGCATSPAPDLDSDQHESTSEVDQEIGGGSCPAHDNCYAFCRIRFKCTSPDGCDRLASCLDQCDADYPTCV